MTGAAGAIGSAVTRASQPVAGRQEHRRTHLVVGKPEAGAAYAVRMSFGRVPVATGTLAVRCRGKLSVTALESHE